MAVKAIRGAIQVPENTRESIRDATRELIAELQKRNALSTDRIIAVFFTATPDLDADFPATGAREQGGAWQFIPFLCSVEIRVPGAMERVLRTLMLCESAAELPDIHHVYLGETQRLRPDLSQEMTS
jgi:chorismate mutase